MDCVARMTEVEAQLIAEKILCESYRNVCKSYKKKITRQEKALQQIIKRIDTDDSFEVIIDYIEKIAKEALEKIP